MAVKIRLQKHGKKKAPWFTIVVADSRSPRDGKFIERLGTYDPTTIPATIDVNNEKALEWVNKGAQPTNTVRAILSYKGVLYKKHLLRGVAKGILTQEQADAKYIEFTEGHADQVRRAREQQINKEKRVRTTLLEAETKKKEAMISARKPVVEPTPAEGAEAATEVVAEQTATEPTAEAASPEAATEAPAAEATPAPEAPATEEAPETPAAEEQKPESEQSSEEKPQA